MKWLEFNNMLFETTGLVISKFDALNQPVSQDSFYVCIENRSNATQKKFATQKDRDDYYETIKANIMNSDKIYYNNVTKVIKDTFAFQIEMQNKKENK